MRSSKVPAIPTYTIFLDGQTQRGSAHKLLERIRADAAKRSEVIAGMDTAQYSSILVKDAAVFLDSDLLTYLEKEPYPTQYDRALRYLAEMDASGVRILSRTNV